MPVIGIPVHMLLARLGTQPTREQLVEHLQHLGCDVEGYAMLRRYGCQRCDNILEITETENPPVACDRCGADFREQEQLRHELGTSEVVRMELLAVRPDMFDAGGLARALRHYLEENDQPARYELVPSPYRVSVDAAMAQPESYRPWIACAVVRNVVLDDDAIKTLMKLQENLHWALGRDRKHASIGVYDLDTLQGTSFVYRSVGPDELRFVPLGYAVDDAAAALTPREILEQHPKGKAYAHLLEPYARYPLLCDEAGQVLSLPPIINSEPTRVTRQTRNFFVDVTGTDERLVNRALNILVTSLAELDRGGAAADREQSLSIHQVTVTYPDPSQWRGRTQCLTPDLMPQVVELDAAWAARTIGIELGVEEVAGCLRRMGHAVELGADEPALRVSVPAYRNDIMHPIDLVEDAAIAYGYHNIVPQLSSSMTVGAEQPLERHAAQVRQALTGLGYFEVLTLILSSESQQYEALRLPLRDDRVVIANPISTEQTMIRTSLLPGLLDTFAANIDHEMPQRIFEVGNISRLDPQSETGAGERRYVAAGVMGPKADYAELRAGCEALLRELGFDLEVEPSSMPCFIAGRGARLYARRADGRVVAGELGELHPEVLDRLRLPQPVAVFEVDLGELVAEY